MAWLCLAWLSFLVMVLGLYQQTLALSIMNI
nr:hypothetical protein Q903MT_gene5849 [Picea sitchensis]